MKFRCPKCNGWYDARRSLVRKVIRCPGCHASVRLVAVVAAELRRFYFRSRN